MTITRDVLVAAALKVVRMDAEFRSVPKNAPREFLECLPSEGDWMTALAELERAAVGTAGNGPVPDTSITPRVQPIRETVRRHLGNAAVVATTWASDAELAEFNDDCAGAFAAIRDHLTAALEMLSEPTFEANAAAAILLREWEHQSPDADRVRECRDLVQAILRAQLTGETPPTWETK